MASPIGHIHRSPRNGRSRSSRPRARAPENRTTASRGPPKRSWSGSSVARFSPARRSDSAWAISSCGQPWSACQSRLGNTMRRASTPPARSQGLRSSRHRRSTRSPSSTVIASITTRCLLRSATPATPPKATHQRGSSVRSSRAVTHRTAIHAVRSNAAVDSRWPTPSGNPQQASAAAAAIWARRSPPSSRAIERAERDGDAGGDRGRGAQHHEVAGRDPVCEPGHEGRERWLVDVAPREVALARLQEVQLVAVPPVPARHEQQQERRGSRDDTDPPPGDGRQWLGR